MPHRDPYTREIPYSVSNMETIDNSVFKWLDEKLGIHVDSNKGRKKVPVVWISAERAYQIKREQGVRDQAGALVLPVITYERTGVTKDLAKKGSIYANILPVDDYRRGSITVARKINHNKTAKFANADSKRMKGGSDNVGKAQINFPFNKGRSNKVVYQTISMPLPVYIEAEYQILLRAEYQQQMNEMLSPFITRPGGINSVLLEYENHRYEAFIDASLSMENNISTLEQEERKYETKIKLRVLGYLIGDEKNLETPKYVVRENAVEVKIPRERIVAGDILQPHPAPSFLGTLPPPVASPTALVCKGGPGAGVGTAGGAGADGVVNGASFAGTTDVELTLTRTESKSSLIASFNVAELIMSNTVFSEVPNQTPNGVLTEFTVDNSILSGSEHVYESGLLLRRGAGSDYTVSGATITFADPPESDVNILVTYIKA